MKAKYRTLSTHDSKTEAQECAALYYKRDKEFFERRNMSFAVFVKDMKKTPGFKGKEPFHVIIETKGY